MQVVLVYLQPFRRSSLLKCMSEPKIVINSLKPPILVVQGHSRSSMLTFLRSLSPVLVMISSMSVPIYSHFHVTRANNSRITAFYGVPLSSPSFVGTPFIQWHEILSQNTRDFMLSYGKNRKSLSHLGSDRYRVVTDIHQDRITIANMRYCYASSRA